MEHVHSQNGLGKASRLGLHPSALGVQTLPRRHPRERVRAVINLEPSTRGSIRTFPGLTPVTLHDSSLAPLAMAPPSRVRRGAAS